MNYYPFHIGDYAAHTGHLEPMEDLAYRRLLDVYYMRELPFPVDIQITAKLVRMRSMSADVESVLKEFFILTDDGWRHERCDAEIERMQDKQAKARASAQASVSARRAKSLNASSTNAETNSSGRSTNAEETQTDVELPTPTPPPYISTDVDIKTKRAPRFDALAHLVSLGVDPLIASDWIQHRRSLKAPPTQTAIDGIAREAGRAGTSLSNALAVCCERGWRGFKAEWMVSAADRKGFNGARKTLSEEREAVSFALTGRVANPQLTERDITPEVYRVS